MIIQIKATEQVLPYGTVYFTVQSGSNFSSVCIEVQRFPSRNFIWWYLNVGSLERGKIKYEEENVIRTCPRQKSRFGCLILGIQASVVFDL